MGTLTKTSIKVPWLLFLRKSNQGTFIALILAVTAPALAGTGAGKHEKVIDFEDEVVEGMNKRPLDSLSQISERDRKHRKPHLYRKRGGFRGETEESLRTA